MFRKILYRYILHNIYDHAGGYIVGSYGSWANGAKEAS